MASHPWFDPSSIAFPRPTPPPAGKRILVLAPHPDDELLGCGGTLAQAAASDATTEVLVLYLTDGERGSADRAHPEQVARVRREEASRGRTAIGIAGATHAGFPDGQLQACADSVEWVREAMERFSPDIAMVPAPLDPHPDHRATSAIFAQACQDSSIVKTSVWIYEVQPCFPMNALVRIDCSEAAKSKALAEHRSQGADRLVAAGRGNAAARALYAPAGWCYAEAFRIASRENFVDMMTALGMR